MDFLTVLLLGVALAMDAFAVSICKGLAMGKAGWRSAAVVGAWFGFFQFLMPTLGYYLGRSFYDFISEYDHWIAFFLLAAIGTNMVREAVAGGEDDTNADISVKAMLPLAIATSIDALAVGISMAMEGGNILFDAVCIGIITFLISAFGVKAGSIIGSHFGKKAEIVGGLILIFIGLRILLDHTGVI